MNTVSTPIKELKKNDKVLHYGSVFLITDNAEEKPHHTGTVPVAPCKRIEIVTKYESLDGLLSGYDAFQGLWNVAKIV